MCSFARAVNDELPVLPVVVDDVTFLGVSLVTLVIFFNGLDGTTFFFLDDDDDDLTLLSLLLLLPLRDCFVNML